MLGTERHESRRIDNQLRGRSGRQGDPGESRFYLSLGDDLMRRFNGPMLESMMNRLRVPDDQPIESKMVTRAIRSAQTQVEQQNFEIRKDVLKYDEVLNRQRTVIYDERRKVLEGEDLHVQIESMVDDVVGAYVDGATEGYAEDWDLEQLWTALKALYPVGLDRKAARPTATDGDDLTREALKEELLADVHRAYDEREAERRSAQGGMRELERRVLLSVLDRKWREHLYEMDYLRAGIHLRAMANRDPVVEYQREGFDMFNAMLDGIKEESVGSCSTSRSRPPSRPRRRPPRCRRRLPPRRPLGARAGRGRLGHADPAQPRRRTGGGAHTSRTPAAAGNGAGRHAAPESDAAATTGVLPTVFGGGTTTRRPSELQYSGPAEDGGTTTRTRSGTAPAAPGRAADRGGAHGEPARNRPCPCGSGRKYKHCHGAPTVAHP